MREPVDPNTDTSQQLVWQTPSAVMAASHIQFPRLNPISKYESVSSREDCSRRTKKDHQAAEEK